MKVAILCSGPSLIQFPQEHDYDYVIVVGRAAEFYAGDMWCALDLAAIAGSAGKVLGQPTLLTRAGIYRAVCRIHPEVSRHTLIHAKFPGPDGIRWKSFSSTRAFVYAVNILEASKIDSYGVDLSGSDDWDGNALPTANRSEERWGHEAGVWHSLETWAHSKGVEAQRITRDAVSETEADGGADDHV